MPPFQENALTAEISLLLQKFSTMHRGFVSSSQRYENATKSMYTYSGLVVQGLRYTDLLYFHSLDGLTSCDHTSVAVESSTKDDCPSKGISDYFISLRLN